MPSRLPRLDGAGLLVIICALLLGVPSAASATVRYTSPAGTVASGPCTDTAGSCSIVHLFSVAAANDELVLKPGSYGSASARISSQLLTAANGVNVHGTRGNPARIFSSAAANGAIALQGNTTTLSDVAIDNTSGSALFLNAGLAQRVAAIGGGAGCQPGIGATTFADSLCVARTGSGVVGNAGAGPGTTATIVFRNATLVGSGDGLFLNAGAGLTYDATLSNVIASGGPGNFDIEADNPFGDGATVHVGHSNYDTSTHTGTNTAVDTSPGFNQTAAPRFLDAAARNYHELAGSPTINAGATSALNGGFDFDGLPRVFGAGTDIGADEFAPPGAVTGSASAITTVAAHVAGTLIPNGTASYRFQYGTTTAYGLSTASAVGSSAAPVAAQISGLASGTTYHYRLVASNTSGTVAGGDRSFKTVSLPSSAKPPRISKLTASHRVFAVGRRSTPLTGVTARRHAKGTTFSFRLDQAATMTVRIERKLRGRRVKGRCRRSSRRLRHRPRCTRYVRKVTLKRTGHAGRNRISFTGRVRGRALRPGRYRATFTATSSAGRSKRARLGFKIVRR